MLTERLLEQRVGLTSSSHQSSGSNDERSGLRERSPVDAQEALEPDTSELRTARADGCLDKVRNNGDSHRSMRAGIQYPQRFEVADSLLRMTPSQRQLPERAPHEGDRPSLGTP